MTHSYTAGQSVNEHNELVGIYWSELTDAEREDIVKEIGDSNRANFRKLSKPQTKTLVRKLRQRLVRMVRIYYVLKSSRPCADAGPLRAGCRSGR